MPQVRVLNTAATRNSFTTVGIPFEKGELTENDTLVALNATSQRDKVQWYPQGARWSDNSVKYARCTFPVTINGNTNKLVDVIKSTVHNTSSTFNLDSDVLASINNTRFQIRFRPKRPVKVQAAITNITFREFIPGVYTINIHFGRDIIVSSRGFTNPNIRITGLNGSFAYINNPNGSRRFWRTQNDQNTARKAEIQLGELTTNTPLNFVASEHPNATVYFEYWDFQILDPVTLNFDLGTDFTAVEGTRIGSTTDQYTRVKAFKRFTDLPNLKLAPIWGEIVVDTYRNSPYQHFYFSMGNNYTQYGTGRAGGTYKEQTIFYHGRVELIVTRVNSSSLSPIAYLREENFETIAKNVNLNETVFTLLDSDPPFRNSFNRNLDVLANTAAIARKGILIHKANVPTLYQAETVEDIQAIATNWDGLCPPFKVVPELPEWQTPESARTDLNNLNSSLRSSIPRNFPYLLKDVFFANIRPGDSGGQGGGIGRTGRNFGSFAGYYVFKSAWPSINNLLKHSVRRDHNRPGIFKMPDNTTWDPQITESATIYNSRLYIRNDNSNHYYNTNSEEYGGVSQDGAYGYTLNPEGPLMGPINGSTMQTRSELIWGCARNFGDQSSVFKYPLSHFMMPWLCHTALITMDYHALNLVRNYTSLVKGMLNPYSTSATVYGSLRPPRAIGRPAHMSAYFYELTAEPNLFTLALKKFGEVTGSYDSAYKVSSSYIIRNNPSKFPGNVHDYLLFHLVGEGQDDSILGRDTWASVWMEAIFSRGYYAWYNTCLDYYDGESNFSSEALSIKTGCADTAGTVTLHGYLIDSTDNGSYEFYSTRKRTPWAQEQTVDPYAIPENSPIFWNARTGDLITCLEDRSCTGTLLVLYRHDETNYNTNLSQNFQNYGTSGWYNTNQAEWRMYYEQIILSNKNKSFPKNTNLNLLNLRTNDILTVGPSVDTWSLGYGYHCGWESQRGSATYESDGNLGRTQGNIGPVLPSGEPIPASEFGTEDYVEFNPLKNTVIAHHRSPVFPLTTGRARFFRLTPNVNGWGWCAPAIAYKFAQEQNYYGASNSEVISKGTNLLQYEYNKLVANATNFNFEEDFIIHAGIIPGIFNSPDYYFSARPITLGISVPDIPAPGSNSNYIYTATEEIGGWRITIPSVTVDTTNQGGGGSSSYTRLVTPFRYKITVPSVNIVIPFDVPPLTASAINMQISVRSPRLFTVIKRSIIDFTRLLEFYLPPLSEETVGTFFGQGGEDSNNYLTGNDLQDLLGLSSDAFNDPNYDGPEEGWYDSLGTNIHTGDNIIEYVLNRNFLPTYRDYAAADVQDPI